MRHILLLCLLLFPFLQVHAQTVHVDDISLSRLATVSTNVVRMDVNPVTKTLYYLTTDANLYRVNTETGEQTMVSSSAEHGVLRPQGMAFSTNGDLFLVGNVRDNDEPLTHGIIRRGSLVSSEGEDRAWETLATSEQYPETRFFDHLFNAIVVSPDDEWVFVNSGAATDHGEDQSVGQEVTPGREYPLTTKIFRLPANGTDLILHNNRDSLEARGYIYAEGVRNTFSMAFSGNNLFAVENAGDRDETEEINLILQGHHYGFPWRMGNTDTPQQFAGFDPANDPFINPDAWATQSGFFYNDPDFPTPPEGVAFTDPIPNLGPDADLYRDPADGLIKDGSEENVAVYSFTPHRSPLGLVFDGGALPSPYTGKGFVTSWTATTTTLMSPFDDSSEDILELNMVFSPDEPDQPVMTTRRIASGFSNPVDMTLVDNKLYLIENAGSGEPGLYALAFEVVNTAVQEELPAIPLELSSFPNPARHAASLTLELKSSAQLYVGVFDMLGREIEVLADQPLSPATYNWQIDVSAYPAGAYVVQVRAGDYSTSSVLSVVH